VTNSADQATGSITYAPMVVCPNCAKGLEIRSEMYASFFMAGSTRCARCQNEFDLWRSAKAWRIRLTHSFSSAGEGRQNSIQLKRPEHPHGATRSGLAAKPPFRA
jgi:hypothetical protein